MNLGKHLGWRPWLRTYRYAGVVDGARVSIRERIKLACYSEVRFGGFGVQGGLHVRPRLTFVIWRDAGEFPRIISYRWGL